jgi:hypothetical protein
MEGSSHEEDDFKLVMRGRRKCQSARTAIAPPARSHVTAADHTAHMESNTHFCTPSAEIMCASGVPTDGKGSRAARRKTAKDTSGCSREAKLLVSIANDAAILKETEFYRCMLSGVQTFLEGFASDNRSSSMVPEILCLGLGSLRFGTNSRIQLAALTLMHEVTAKLWGVATSHVPVLAFDPLFDEVDVAVLAHFNMRAVDSDSQCFRRHVEIGSSTGAANGAAPLVPAIYFMPHCNSDTYDKVLSHELESGTLLATCIIGNSFYWYCSSWGLCESAAAKEFDDKDVTLKKFAALNHVCRDVEELRKSLQTPGCPEDARITPHELCLPSKRLDELYLRALDSTRCVLPASPPSYCIITHT